MRQPERHRHVRHRNAREWRQRVGNDRRAHHGGDRGDGRRQPRDGVGNELDPTPANNQAAATITVQPLVDLELTKVASNPTPAAGGSGQLHADPGQQRTEPRDRGHAHRPAAERPLVPICERRPGQLQRLRAKRSPASSARLPLGGTAIATVTVLVAASDGRHQRAEHRDRDGRPADRPTGAAHRERLDPRRSTRPPRRPRPTSPSRRRQPKDRPRRRGDHLHDHRHQPWAGHSREPDRHRCILEIRQARLGP